ncbi:hypothetical protein F0562_032819 [Nyssa sinensis]|uniref:F-box associated domain-containing protein n=1 Tax=Nyssa sinensis TaxID=561372 RepID=A0A5J5ASG2_9ASTE|nr:hypothetical protein F0562_032819 [Nyssa sinensis]
MAEDDDEVSVSSEWVDLLDPDPKPSTLETEEKFPESELGFWERTEKIQGLGGSLKKEKFNQSATREATALASAMFQNPLMGLYVSTIAVKSMSAIPVQEVSDPCWQVLKLKGTRTSFSCVSPKSNLTQVGGHLALMGNKDGDASNMELWILEDYHFMDEEDYCASTKSQADSHITNDRAVRTIRIGGLPGWVDFHGAKHINFNITNHVESFMPLAQIALKFGDFSVHLGA